MDDLTRNLAILANEAGRRVGEALRPHYDVRVEDHAGKVVLERRVQTIDADRAKAAVLGLLPPGQAVGSVITNLVHESSRRA
jgi:hypothetical protein